MTLYRPEPSARRRSGQLLWFGAWAIITAIGIYLHPDHLGHGTHQQLGLPPCPSVLFLDRPCPGCGLTTSWSALLHGDFALAFRAHPFGPIVYFFFTLGAWLAFYGWRTKQLLLTETDKFTRYFLVGFAIFFGFGLYRMSHTRLPKNLQEQVLTGVIQMDDARRGH